MKSIFYAVIAFVFMTMTFVDGKSQRVVLSAGLGGYSELKLKNLYNMFNVYRDMKIVTDSSILIYNINEDGMLGTYNTSSSSSAEIFQHSLIGIGIRALPCVYCDETIGMCSRLSSRLPKLYANRDKFIKNSIDKAVKYGWSGYTLDIEPVSNIDGEQLTEFVIEWANALSKLNLSLTIWIGGDTVYNMTKLYNVDPSIDMRIATMQTYTSSYIDFINQANAQLIRINNSSRLDFGLLTSARKFNVDYFELMSESAINKIADWTSLTEGDLSIWATVIPPEWFGALKRYVAAI